MADISLVQRPGSHHVARVRTPALVRLNNTLLTGNSQAVKQTTVLSDQLPPIPRVAHPRSWAGITYDNQIAQLLFGEVLAMQVARQAGLPVPRVICYGEHADSPHAPVSILITRVPGKELGQVYDTLSDEEKEMVFRQLDRFSMCIRNWENSWGESRICLIVGTRVSNHLAGPFRSEQELNDYLREPAWSEAMNRARKMDELPHRIVFTHGDLKHYNIMVRAGRITGFLDWKSAGWYSEYWAFTTALRFTPEDFWWALTCLASASYYW
ncbi:uncharacterized protein BO66DRAFT_414994 [Aspergillus aculeatinus CBS 121060]|uniref:Uncharacterized protein n=1 Tax=Aspergillus aculeatinus CBS 121060 TaxID=1448322 RepID=A0ACD1GWN8_9EURO|nr:hypothetical protein BO66DRAFT_414994 [Aspergillus aculeatinus CBS 121060]RAH65617.1 hypothetical protein BO66DRAFT_414994 [Aspergillus aculeatinus CBS 121060]